MRRAQEDRWYFTKEQINNTPSVKCGFSADRELSCRQQAANFIQDMGQRLQVTQLCINTAIVYMHRFYMFHSFTHFHRTAISAAALFLAAKVEEQPRKLEHVIKVAYMCLHREQSQHLDTKSEQYLELAQDLVVNENVLLQTLGFDVAIDHPHTHVVQCCRLVKASKDLAQTSYFMASNSLHLTTMCLQYKPTLVACFCIHLAIKWSNWQIPESSEGRPWFWYVDQTVTQEALEQLTGEFLAIFDRCPSRLKRKIMAMSANQNPSLLSNFPDTDKKTKSSAMEMLASTSGISQHRSLHHMSSDDVKQQKSVSGSSQDPMTLPPRTQHNYKKLMPGHHHGQQHGHGHRDHQKSSSHGHLQQGTSSSSSVAPKKNINRPQMNDSMFPPPVRISSTEHSNNSSSSGRQLKQSSAEHQQSLYNKQLSSGSGPHNLGSQQMSMTSTIEQQYQKQQQHMGSTAPFNPNLHHPPPTSAQNPMQQQSSVLPQHHHQPIHHQTSQQSHHSQQQHHKKSHYEVPNVGQHSLPPPLPPQPPPPATPPPPPPPPLNQPPLPSHHQSMSLRQQHNMMTTSSTNSNYNANNMNVNIKQENDILINDQNNLTQARFNDNSNSSVNSSNLINIKQEYKNHIVPDHQRGANKSSDNNYNVNISSLNIKHESGLSSMQSSKIKQEPCSAMSSISDSATNFMHLDQQPNMMFAQSQQPVQQYSQLQQQQQQQHVVHHNHYNKSNYSNTSNQMLNIKQESVDELQNHFDFSSNNSSNKHLLGTGSFDIMSNRNSGENYQYDNGNCSSNNLNVKIKSEPVHKTESISMTSSYNSFEHSSNNSSCNISSSNSRIGKQSLHPQSQQVKSMSAKNVSDSCLVSSTSSTPLTANTNISGSNNSSGIVQQITSRAIAKAPSIFSPEKEPISSSSIASASTISSNLVHNTSETCNLTTPMSSTSSSLPIGNSNKLKRKRLSSSSGSSETEGSLMVPLIKRLEQEEIAKYESGSVHLSTSSKTISTTTTTTTSVKMNTTDKITTSTSNWNVGQTGSNNGEHSQPDVQVKSAGHSNSGTLVEAVEVGATIEIDNMNNDNNRSKKHKEGREHKKKKKHKEKERHKHKEKHKNKDKHKELFSSGYNSVKTTMDSVSMQFEPTRSHSSPSAPIERSSLKIKIPKEKIIPGSLNKSDLKFKFSKSLLQGIALTGNNTNANNKSSQESLSSSDVHHSSSSSGGHHSSRTTVKITSSTRHHHDTSR